MTAHISLYYKFLVLIALTFVAPNVMSSVENIRFEKINNHSEMSQQTVTSIFQDSRGFMWFGTQDGLNKYDGINFTIYQPKYNDTNAISGRWIHSISEDSSGNIWVGTDTGLNVLNIDTNKFTQYTGSAQNAVGSDGISNSINDSRVSFVHKDSQGTMWVATSRGLNQFITDRKVFKHHNFFDVTSNSAIAVSAISEDITGTLWLGTSSHGLMKFDSVTEQLTMVPVTLKDNTQEIKFSVRTLYIDNDQVLWIGTSDDGLLSLDFKVAIDAGTKASVRVVSGIEREDIYTVSKDHHSTLWVGSTEGVYYKKQFDDEFQLLKNSPAGYDNLLDDEVWSIYPDRSGVLWIGTFNGLHKWDTRTSQFDHFYSHDSRLESLSSNDISMIGSDLNNLIYIGTRTGLDILNPETGEIRNLPLETASAAGLKEPRVMSFAYVSEEEIWFGYRTSGATKYNPLSNSFTHYAANSEDPKALPKPGVTSIIHTQNGDVWFSTFFGGISRFNRDTNDFTTYNHSATDISTLSSNKVITLYEAQDGNLWVGTWDAGISVFVPTTGTAFRIQRDKNQPSSLGSDRVVSFLEDSDQNMWVGTHGGGLNMLNAHDKNAGNITFEKFDTENGMPSNVAYGLLQDDQGYIWSSTNKGLVKINRETKAINVYTESHGIQSNEFNSGTHHKDANGYLYFGGGNGVTRFNPLDIQPNPVTPNVVFTSFQRLNKIQSIAEATNEDGSIEVFYEDYLIGFEFAALDFASPAHNQYTYKLEGFDKEWLNVREARGATYTNLPSGNYTFRVRASNSNGVWNEQGSSVSLIVNPAPWYSWWAFSIYAFVCIALALYIIRALKIKAKKGEQFKAKLMHEVNIRTSELQEANQLLLEASITDQLTGVYNRRYLSETIEQLLESTLDKFSKAILDGKMNASNGPRLMALMFDLDKFKAINDTYGHEAGDQVIKQVGQLLQKHCAKNDILIRWGGDEYLMVCEVSNLNDAQKFVEQIREAVSSFEFDIGLSKKLHFSSSLGFALYPFNHFDPHSISWDQVHLLADHALYKAKAAGRNQWAGIVQSDTELSFGQLNSLVPNVDSAIQNKEVLLVQTTKKAVTVTQVTP